MISKEITHRLIELAGEENVYFNEMMSGHTTFRVGGMADVFVTPKSEKEAVEVVRLLLINKIPCFILGNGSNLLVSDKGYRGVVVRMFSNYDTISVEGNIIHAKAGALLSRLSQEAAKASLTGLEFASGIPGTLGGGIYMNAGAYGGEMKQIVEEVKIYDFAGDKVVTYSGEEMGFGYRSSILKSTSGMVLNATLRLEQGDKDKIDARMKELKELRCTKQPLEYPSAGSTFKRPEGYFAGKLIEDAGLKGYNVNGAEVSQKHSGFVINKGGAKAEDILTLIRDVRRIVYENSGVELEPEVLMIGEDFAL